MLFYMPKAGPKAVKTFVHAQWIVKETTLPFLVSTPIFSQCFDSKKFAVRKYPHTYALYTLLFFFIITTCFGTQDIRLWKTKITLTMIVA